MSSYRGQKYNPAEDDGITTESLFNVIDADSGQQIDVRELLGLSEEDFKNNPDLLNCLQHMNNLKPVDSVLEKKPTIEDEESKDGWGDDDDNGGGQA